MDAQKTFRIAIQKWYLVVIGVVVSLAAGAVAYFTTPPSYTSTATFVVSAPVFESRVGADADALNLVNPLLTFSEGLNSTASLLVQVAQSPDTQAALGAPPGGRTTYTAGDGSSNPELSAKGPFVFLDSESSDPREATAVLQRVATKLHTDLADRQSALGVRPADELLLSDVVSPTVAERHSSSQVRAAISALALTLIVVLFLLYASAAIAERRSSRHTPKPRSGRARPQQAFDDPETVTVERKNFVDTAARAHDNSRPRR